MAKPDEGVKLTERELNALEKRIAAVYRQAAKELDAEVKAYFAGFEVRDAEQKSRVDAGEITEQQYRQWRLNQIARGKRFEALRDKMAQRYTQANETSVAYVNDATPGIYSLNRNYAAYTIEQVSDKADFTLWDERTVRRMIIEQPDSMPYYPLERAVRRGIDLSYGKRQITASVTCAILQGKSIGQIADDLQQRIQTMNRNSAIRSARTAVTGAQNAGRLDSYAAAEKMGIKLKKQWLATLDGRTRHSHALLDGESMDRDRPFSNGCMFPGDPNGKPEEVYNCRCTLVADLDGIKQTGERRAIDLKTGETILVKDMTYAQWAGWKLEGKQTKFDSLVYKGRLNENIRIQTELILSKIPGNQRRLAEKAISHIELVESDIGSGYEPRTGIIYLSVKSPPYAIVHEYGHALEKVLKIYSDPKFIAIRNKGFENISVRDIIFDDETFSEPVYRIENEKLVSIYQGRLYESYGIYDGKNISLDGMREYFSEGYREFYENSENLKKHDPDLYDYIQRL